MGSGDGFPQMGTAFTGLRKLLQSVLNNNFSHALALHAPSQFGWKSSKKHSLLRESPSMTISHHLLITLIKKVLLLLLPSIATLSFRRHHCFRESCGPRRSALLMNLPPSLPRGWIPHVILFLKGSRQDWCAEGNRTKSGWPPRTGNGHLFACGNGHSSERR